MIKIRYILAGINLNTCTKMNQIMQKSKKSLICKILLLTLICLSLNACVKKPREATEGAKSRVAQVSIEYLRLCFLGNMKLINSYVLLSEYLKNQGLSLDEYTSEIERLPRRWQVDTHPVLQLVLLEVNVRDDKAKTYFQRGGAESDFPRIEIELEWSGTSWVITNDTIFGVGGLFQNRR